MKPEELAKRDALTKAHLYLVRAMANRMHEALPSAVEIDDLEQAGRLGLMGAAANFDASRGPLFATYARHRIRGAMLDWLRGVDHLSRDERQKVKAGLQADAGGRVFSGDPSGCDAEEDVLTQEAVDLSPSPEAVALDEDRSRRLRAAMQRLSPRYREVLRSYYWSELTMKEIGALLNVNESRISQIHATALEKLAELAELQELRPLAA